MHHASSADVPLHQRSTEQDLLRRKHLLASAAAWLGLDSEAGQRFANEGSVSVDGIEFSVPESGLAGGPLLVRGMLPRPRAIHPILWREILLLANEPAMAAAEWGFTLSEDESASLMLLVPEALQTPSQVGASVRAMLELCVAVRDGALDAIDTSGASR